MNNKTVCSFRDRRELFNLFKKIEWKFDCLELEEKVNGGMEFLSMVVLKFDKSGLIVLQ